jgi:hypothetical protein
MNPLVGDGSPGRRLRGHLPFAVLLLAGVVLRVVVASTYRPLLFYGDSYSYLGVAKQPFVPFYRPAGYPWFLYPWYHLHALGAVPWIQHLVGVGVAVAVYALLRRLGVGPWLGALAAAPVLLDAYQLDIEQFLLAEALFEALVVGAIVAAMWSKRPSIPAAAVAGALLAAAGLTRTVGLVLIMPLLLYLAVKRVGVLRFGAAVTAFAVPLVLYASWYHADRGRYEVTGADGYFLYGRVATFATCSHLPLQGDEWILCDTRPTERRPSANAYIWGHHAPLQLLVEGTKATRSSVLLDFSLRVIRHQPGAYAATVLGDVGHYFAPGRHTGRHDEPVAMWRFSDRFPIRHRVHDTLPPRYGGPPGPRRNVVGGAAPFLISYQRFAFTPGPLLALGLLLGLVGIVGRRRGSPRRMRAEPVTLAVLGLLVLLVPAATAMFDYRYLLPSLPLLPAAGALGASVLWERIRGPREEQPTDESPPLELPPAAVATPEVAPTVS